MMYSILPPEVVLADPAASVPPVDAVPLGPGSSAVLLVRRLPGGGATIQRVVSTDPRHFLDPALAPGQAWAGDR
jgi:hypothetical protein